MSDAPNPVSTHGTARVDGRQAEELRPVAFRLDVAPAAPGSVLIEWGNTRVLCGVSIEETVPRWMKEQGVPGGWITAEYSMLPYSTQPRKPRDISKGKLDGRSQEIQRLIGRALRAIVNLTQLGTRTVWIDCDVLQADGGTRTAAITGSYVALQLAIRKLMRDQRLSTNPTLTSVAAVSIGVVQGRILTDLCYTEDSQADVDLNLVMTGQGRFIEIQGTGERDTFDAAQLNTMIQAGHSAIQRLQSLQDRALLEAV